MRWQGVESGNRAGRRRRIASSRQVQGNHERPLAAAGTALPWPLVQLDILMLRVPLDVRRFLGAADRYTEKLATKFELVVPAAIGQEAIMADPHKRAGQYMEQKTPRKLRRLQRYALGLVAVRVIFPANVTNPCDNWISRRLEIATRCV
jgi:hypothetical protein